MSDRKEQDPQTDDEIEAANITMELSRDQARERRHSETMLELSRDEARARAHLGLDHQDGKYSVQHMVLSICYSNILNEIPVLTSIVTDPQLSLSHNLASRTTFPANTPNYECMNPSFPPRTHSNNMVGSLGIRVSQQHGGMGSSSAYQGHQMNTTFYGTPRPSDLPAISPFDDTRFGVRQPTRHSEQPVLTGFLSPEDMRLQGISEEVARNIQDEEDQRAAESLQNQGCAGNINPPTLQPPVQSHPYWVEGERENVLRLARRMLQEDG
jgi:hypothetical protein